MTTASVPGKIILFGEHAVVYGRPAIAIPVRQVQVTVEVTDFEGAETGRIYVEAPDIQLSSWLHEITPDHPLKRIIDLTLVEINAVHFPGLLLTINSSLPISAGLGSGAAVSVAIVRALSAHLDSLLPLERQSELSLEVERIHHGTPSGIDNTVVTFNQPVFFIKGHKPETFCIGAPFMIVIGDTGLSSSTAVVVDQVRLAWENNTSKYETAFNNIGQIAVQARRIIEKGQILDLGPLMNQNQSLLEDIGVSSPELRTLIYAARDAGASGAKLSGAGLGGNMIALVNQETAGPVEKALQSAGAVGTIRTEVKS
jgi:mevalonate kinase